MPTSFLQRSSRRWSKRQLLCLRATLPQRRRSRSRGTRRSGGRSSVFDDAQPYSFSKNSHPEQEIKIPPPTLRSRSLTRFTIRVGLPHLGQSVLLVVSMIFLRSAVLAILAMVLILSCQMVPVA